MNSYIIRLLLLCAGQTAAEIEPAHRQNRVYVELLQAGPVLAGSKLQVPPPILRDGLDQAEQRRALVKVAGSEAMTESMLRDSVTAPYILKIRDTPTDTAILRQVDLWFVVRGDLKGVEPLKLAGENSGKPVEVGNMRFESRILTLDEIKASGRSTLSGENLSSWFVMLKGRLLGRIGFQATDEVMASRSEESMVVAARTSDAFPAGPNANRWRTLGANVEEGANKDEPFEGGITYTKITRLKEPADALLVELHCVFCEPRGWFQGEPILRSKFGVVAQDQIRRLRRELIARRSNG